jgi:hypothetical protein
VKAAPEQRRLCSPDEDATCSDVLKRLCQVRDDLRHAWISGISDIMGEERPSNPEHPTGKRRHISKQPPFSALKHQRTEKTPSIAYEPSLANSEGLEAIDDVANDTESFESDQDMLLEVIDSIQYDNIAELQQPALRMYHVEKREFSMEVNKKAAKELKLKDVSPHDFELFRSAIRKERQTNLESGAI